MRRFLRITTERGVQLLLNLDLMESIRYTPEESCPDGIVVRMRSGIEYVSGQPDGGSDIWMHFTKGAIEAPEFDYGDGVTEDGDQADSGQSQEDTR